MVVVFDGIGIIRGEVGGGGDCMFIFNIWRYGLQRSLSKLFIAASHFYLVIAIDLTGSHMTVTVDMVKLVFITIYMVLLTLNKVVL